MPYFCDDVWNNDMQKMVEFITPCAGVSSQENKKKKWATVSRIIDQQRDLMSCLHVISVSKFICVCIHLCVYRLI